MTKQVAGPKPDPRKPKLKAPPHACDSHCHVFGPVDRFAFVPEREYTPPEAPLEKYQALLDHLGLERTVIVQPSIHGFDNSVSEDALNRMNGRARGVAVVRPDITGTELKRLDEAGFTAVRFNLFHAGGRSPLDDMEELARKVAPLDWHVQIYMFGKDLPDLAPRLEELPTDVVIDHLGHFDVHRDTNQPEFRRLLQLMESGRYWVKICPYRFDVSGFPYAKAKPFVRALNEVAPERLVWGTDWPHPDVPGPIDGENGSMPDDGDLLDALGQWFDDTATINQILTDNPARLYRFNS